MLLQYKIVLIALIATFLINLVTYSEFETDVSAKKFLKFFYTRSEDQTENLRLYIFQISFWSMAVIMFLANVVNR